MSVSHVLPVKPGGHEQLNPPLPTFVHVPEFKHGLVEHATIVRRKRRYISIRTVNTIVLNTYNSSYQSLIDIDLLHMDMSTDKYMSELLEHIYPH